MRKQFDAVKFQRQRRAELSEKFSTMSDEEIVKYLKRVKLPKKTKTNRRLATA